MTAANKIPPWFPCYPTKLLGALAQMQPDEGYLYAIILLRIYETWGPISDSVPALARRAGFRTDRTARLLATLIENGKVERTKDGKISNHFAAEIMDQQSSKLIAARNLKIMAAESRWRKGELNQQNGHAHAMHSHAERELELELLPSFPDGKEAHPQAGAPSEAKEGAPTRVSPSADYYRRGRQVLGDRSGGMLKQLIEARGELALARASVETASTKGNPREYIASVIRGEKKRAADDDREPYWDPAF